MRKELTMKTLKAGLFGIVVVFIMGIVFLYFTAGSFFRVIKGHSVFEELLPEEINNQIVDITLKDNFGMFMEEYSKNTETNIERSEAFYYVIWTGDDNAENYRYMAIRVPVSYEDEMEEMAENTYNYIASEPIEFSGAIEKMSDEDYRYFKEYFMESGFTEEEFEEATIPYYIHVGKLTDGVFVLVFLFVFGVACTIGSIIIVIMTMNGNSIKKIFTDFEEAGYSESVAEIDYAAAVEFKNTVKIGNLFTFYIDKKGKARALLNKELVWVYLITTTHRTNGIKTGTTYEMNLFSVKNPKQAIKIQMKNEQASRGMMEYINEHMPWVIVGYTDEISKLYYKDYETFLQQRYYVYRTDDSSAI